MDGAELGWSWAELAHKKGGIQKQTTAGWLRWVFRGPQLGPHLGHSFLLSPEAPGAFNGRPEPSIGHPGGVVLSCC